MAYIKQELALELLKRNSITEHITFSDGVSIYDTIANIPAADVVPKTEVERLKKALAAQELALQDKARECNIAVDKICLEHREEIRALQEKHKAELAALREKLEKLNKDRYQILPDGRIELLPRTDIDAIKTEVAREIFWEIDMLLTAIYLDDEDGTHFVGVDIQKYHALRKEKHEKLKTERTKRNESKNRI